MVAEISANTASQTSQGGGSCSSNLLAQAWCASCLSSAAMIRPESAILITMRLQCSPNLCIRTSLGSEFAQQVPTGKAALGIREGPGQVLIHQPQEIFCSVQTGLGGAPIQIRHFFGRHPQRTDICHTFL